MPRNAASYCGRIPRIYAHKCRFPPQTWTSQIDAKGPRCILKRPAWIIARWLFPNPKLSLAMIVKNEARCLARCLQSVKGIADEIVIADTGSTDDTVKLRRILERKS